MKHQQGYSGEHSEDVKTQTWVPAQDNTSLNDSYGEVLVPSSRRAEFGECTMAYYVPVPVMLDFY